MEAVNNVVN